MDDRSGFLSRILHPPSDSTVKGADLDTSYKKFSRELSTLLTVLVFVPLTIVTLLSLYDYRQLLQDEELDQLILHMEQTAITMEKFVDELKSVILLVAPDDRYLELSNQEELEIVFAHLQGLYPGFVEIEVIGPQGAQKSYVGPNTLTGGSYSEKSWFSEALSKGVYISSVYSGYGKVPLFIIAVSRQSPGTQERWVLRVSVEADTLQSFIDTVSAAYDDELFLIDADGFPQTQPMEYGKFGEQCTLPILQKTAIDERGRTARTERNIILQTTSEMKVAQEKYNGQQVIQAVVHLPDTPWRLVLVKEQYLHADAWNLFKIRLVTILPFCLIVAGYVISKISHAITDHLREFDLKRKQFLVEAEQPNKLASIGRLAAGVAHEINNPLAIINQKAGLVQDFIEMSENLQFKESMENALAGIQSSVERCKKITHRLLGFARQTDVKVEEVDLNVMIRDVVDFLAREAAYNKIKIVFDLDQDISNIYSDRGQLQQIFLNITNNAIDAIGKNGQITLSSSQVDQETVQIQIIDDGPGMPSEVQQRIFDPFFTTKETGKGTGLGLSIVYGLINKLGGNINVTSELNKGTTFSITLPVKQSGKE